MTNIIIYNERRWKEHVFFWLYVTNEYALQISISRSLSAISVPCGNEMKWSVAQGNVPCGVYLCLNEMDNYSTYS